MPGLNYLIGKMNGSNPVRNPRVPSKQQSVLMFNKKDKRDVRFAEGDGFPSRLFFNGEEMCTSNATSKSRFSTLSCNCWLVAFIAFWLTSVTLTLYFTILKPKQPKLTTKEVTIQHLTLILSPFHLNFTLGITVNVDNPNYGSFKYDNTTAYITYRDATPVAEAPIEADTLPARGQHDISTAVPVVMDSLITNPYFVADFFAGCLNFTSSSTFKGKATVLKFMKIKATTYSTCNISVYVVAQNVSSVCRSQIKY
ncbi:hypothetical protein BUALT_Bualt03G0073500 [Buddleja alternifolia]|uniref:Late embryogenesis abundant protein LEA-2 subgroup domain-containing protein n=1 Tax=Buddleja alternifolia TaxID=168488 RepID=A0AAV6Y319_9LAMI|nr:hypothetical protein BUALT_Bualt03G0073500 [Buddleja alternifolia]